jgi:hypothetical protein
MKIFYFGGLTFERNYQLRIVSELHQLQQLTLNRCLNVTTVRNLPMLTFLSIETDCLSFSMDFESLPLLTSLEFYGICKSDKVKFDICSPFKTMKLVKCENIDLVLLTDLRSLKVERCRT